MDGVTQSIGAQAGDLSALTRLAQAEGARGEAAAGKSEHAAKMFEELLSTTLVREMRRGLDDGFFGGGTGSDVYEGWLDDSIGKALARSHTLDIAQAVRISLDGKTATEAKEGTRP